MQFDHPGGVGGGVDPLDNLQLRAFFCKESKVYSNGTRGDVEFICDVFRFKKAGAGCNPCFKIIENPLLCGVILRYMNLKLHISYY